jgi:hypothetical protein
MVYLGGYTLSADVVKQIAESMRTQSGWIGTVAEAMAGSIGYKLAGKYGAAYGAALAVAAALSINASSKAAVLYAADKGYGVAVDVYDGDYHTSYSTTVEFTVLD